MRLDGKSVYVIGGNRQIESLFRDAGGIPQVSMDNADIVCWTGGADVNPALYGEDRHPLTHMNKERDEYEVACYRHMQALSAYKPRLKVGICRGAQFLNVMNKGKLWQDVNNHAISGTHPVTYRPVLTDTDNLETWQVNSTHHQQMIPHREGQVWGFTGLSRMKKAGIKLQTGGFLVCHYAENHSSDAEIVWYPKTKSLCFQPHPEYSSKTTTDLFWNCMSRAMKDAA
jgi:hypothetical protein